MTGVVIAVVAVVAETQVVRAAKGDAPGNIQHYSSTWGIIACIIFEKYANLSPIQ